MSDDEEADVLRAKNTVRTAYDNLQALKKSRGSTIPSSLSKAGVALDQLSRNLDLLTASSEALSIFRGYVLRGTSVSSGTSLSDAIVDDMQAIATYFRFMKPISPSEMLGNLNEQQCRDIEDMVDRYERIVHSVLSQHNISLLNSLATQGRETQEEIYAIRLRLTEQYDSEVVDIRTKVYDRLKPISSACYDSSVAPTGCLQGTRVAIQKELTDWANDGAQELTTFWLNGMAGTGKTAIASTFAWNMKDLGILGATFFIDRQQEERRDLSRIVQTLAYDLAQHSHEQLRAVWIALRSDPAFERLPYQKQVQLLIKEPLDIGCPETLVISIDGLDECSAFTGALLLATLVKSLARHPIKLFVTSRNEADIANTFRNILHTPIKLQETGVSGDVRLYWERNLDELCDNRNLPSWRSTVVLEELVELTGHLFIYATTMLKIIRNTRTSPVKKLRGLLDISRSGSGSGIAFVGPDNHGPLEKLYIHVLEEAMKDDDGNTSAEYALHLHDILEVVIFAQAPITLQALSDLLHMDLNDLVAYLATLYSVLIVPDITSSDGEVLPLHQSFPDFLRQQGGIVHPRLTMHIAFAHKNVAERCLSQLSKLLHFDMCGIKDVSLFNDEALNLNTQQERISDALHYSCKYWLIHWLEYIRAIGFQSQVPLGSDEFCGERLLHCIEVLNLTEDLYAVKRVMSKLNSVMNVRFDMHIPQGCLREVTVALRKSLDIASAVFEPLDIIYRFILNDATIDGLGKRDLKAQAQLRSMLGCIVASKEQLSVKVLAQALHLDEELVAKHTDILSSILIIAPDGVRPFHPSLADFLLDARRCTPEWAISVHDIHLLLAGFCFDMMEKSFTKSERTATSMLDATQVTRIRQSLPSSSGLHYACANWAIHVASMKGLSADVLIRTSRFCADLILSWLEAICTMDCVNDAREGLQSLRQCVSSPTVPSMDLNHLTVLLRDAFLLLDRYGFALKNHPEHIYHTGCLFMPKSVLFANSLYHPLGRLIVGGQSQPAIFARRVKAQVVKAWCVAASPKGTIIATGSTDNSIHLWDPKGDLIDTLTGHMDKVQCLAFSPNESTLASGSADRTIRLYDMHTLECTNVLRGHTKRVSSVAFSLDGRIISGSWDKSVRTWRVDIEEAVESFSMEKEVFSIAISPDDNLIAIGGAKMLVLYDRRTPESRPRTLGNMVCSVFSVAFSPAGDRLAAGMQDGSVCSWDLSQPEGRGTTSQRSSFDNSVAITSVAWSSDGTKIFSASREKIIQVHDGPGFGRRTGKVITRGFTSSLRDLSLLPHAWNPRLVAVDEDGGMTIWGEGVDDVSSASIEALDFAAVAFSPDGALLATASSMGIVIIRNSADGDTMGTLRGPGAGFRGLFFSEDGAKLSLLCEDGSESTWKAGIDFTVPSRLSSPDTLARDEMMFTSDDDGWLYAYHSQLPARLRTCWIQPDRRWSRWLEQVAWSGTKIAFGNDNGDLTVIDFADVGLFGVR